MAPSRLAGRHLMILQAFVDESDKDGICVIAGHVSTPEKWARLSAEWEELLRKRQGVWVKGRHTFKMNQMARTEDGMRRTEQFYRLIEEYCELSVSAVVRLSDMRRAMARIMVPGWKIDWGYFANPWMNAYRLLMDGFHEELGAGRMLEDVFPHDAQVEFWFDERAEKKKIRRAWVEYVSSRRSHVRERYSREPQFEHDDDYLSLQAADLWAFWVRRWDAEGHPEKMSEPDFGFWAEKKQRPKLHIHTDEDGLAKIMREAIAAIIEPKRPVYDMTYSWGGERLIPTSPPLLGLHYKLTRFRLNR
jgi:hypothetical protein